MRTVCVLTPTTTAILGLGLIVGTAAAAGAQTLRVWGGDGSGQVSQAPEGRFRALAQGGATQSIAIRSDGTLTLWGGLADPFAAPPIPDALLDERFAAVVLGRTHALGIRNDLTLVAWGRPEHDFGQLTVPEGRFTTVTAGNRHSVGLQWDGRLQAWGANDVGQIQTPAGMFTDVAARVLYSIAIRDDGVLIGWGSSPVFEGWMTMPGSSYPFVLQDGRFTAVAAGIQHALAIRARDGRVAGWGVAEGGALAAPDRRFKKIAAGSGFSVGIDVDGTLWGWGTPVAPPSPLPFYAWSFESAGWKRLGETEHYYIPDEKFQDVAAAAFHVVALTAGRRAR